MVMGLRAYGICRDCAGLYPSSRGCPNCDGDKLSADHMETARVAHVVGAKLEPAAVPRLGRSAKTALFAAFGISLFVGSLVIAVLQA